MTFSFNTGMSSGNGGTVIYSGNCNFSQPVATGRSGGGYTEYAYTCVLPKTITLQAGSLYWVNINPSLSNDFQAFASTAINSPPHHIGWGNYTDDSFFYSTYFNANYVNATTQGSYFTEFSVGMTGQYVQIY
jgi:hypothetical protein